MNLNELKFKHGSRRHKVKIVGRGHGSGMGKTSTRGSKGQNSRKSGTVRPGFEGGQTPIYRRLPKIGFNNYRFADHYEVLNLKNIDKMEETNLTISKMRELGLITKNTKLVKVIGNNDLTKSFTIEAHKFSTNAKLSIEKSGGKALEVA